MGGPCNSVNATIVYNDSTKLSLTGSATHNVGNMAADTISEQTWNFTAIVTGLANITVNATGSERQAASDTVAIRIVSSPPVPPPATYFSDNAESGENGWIATGFWHITTRRNNSPTHSWWYGNETTGTYQTGSARNFWDLTSPLINLTTATAPVLTFYNYWNTEAGTTWDAKKVSVSTDNGATWTTVLQISANPYVWHQRTVNLGSYAGAGNKDKVLFRHGRRILQ